MGNDPLGFKLQDYLRTEVLGPVSVRIRENYVHVAGLMFSSSIATLTHISLMEAVPPANFVSSIWSNGLCSQINYPPNFLHLRPRNLMFIKLIIEFNPNLLYSSKIFPSLVHYIIQGTASSIKVPFPSSSRTTAPDPPECFQGLEFGAVLQVGILC